MVYSERYYHVFCDKFANSYRASILERDYQGAAELVEGGPLPAVIRYESFSDYKFDAIRASQCILTLIATKTFNTQNLYTGDEKKFKIEIHKNASLYWSGYLVPNGLKENFTGPPHYITITATDYLAGLKSIKFQQADGSLYQGRQTFIDVITNCVSKTDLQLPLDTSVNVYPTGITPGPGVDPLNETDINVQTFVLNRDSDFPGNRPRGAVGNPRPRTRMPSESVKTDKPDKDRPMNCYEVISYNATLWNSRFFQEDARWKFERINYKYLQGTIRHYDATGRPVGNSLSASPRIIGCANPPIKLIGGIQTLAMDRVFKRVSVEYRFAFTDTENNVTNFIKNGNFEDFNDSSPGIFNHWIQRGDISVKRVTQGVNDGVWIDSFSKKDRYFESWWIEVQQGDEISMSITFRLRPGSTGNNIQHFLVQLFVKGYSLFDTVGRQRSASQFIYASNSADRNSNAKWFSYPVWIVFPIDPAKDQGKMITVPYYTDPIPGNGKLYVRLFGTGDRWYNPGDDDLFLAGGNGPSVAGNPNDVSPTPGDEDYWASTSTFGVVECYNVSIGKQNPTQSKESMETSFVEEQSGSFTDEPEVIGLLNADDSSKYHISGIKLHDSGIDTSLWIVDGQPEYQPKPIGNIVARSVLEQYKQPYHIIEGAIQGPDLKFSDVFQFDMDGVEGELFLVQRGSFDLLNSRLNDATFVQITDSVVDSEGTIDGNNPDPNWMETGNTRCKRDASGHNTGEVEAEEQDYNPFSPTYSQTRWTITGEDAGRCPIGEYYEYLWGASTEQLNTDDLLNWPFSEFPNKVTVWFSNDGGKWLWFLHRPTAGTVVSILDIENEETIADWAYQPDVSVGGETFKAIRMDYPTGTYKNLPKSFVFG